MLLARWRAALDGQPRRREQSALLLAEAEVEGDAVPPRCADWDGLSLSA